MNKNFRETMRFHDLLSLRGSLKRLDWHKLGLKNYLLLVNEVESEIEKSIEEDRKRRE